MRRSTRLSIKRTNFTPNGTDSSDEDEPKKSKPKSKITSKNKLLHENPNQQYSSTDESTEITSKPKANNIDKSSNNKSKQDDEDFVGFSSESSFTPDDSTDSSDEYEPEKSKPEHKINGKTKLLRKKPNQQNRNRVESTKITSQPKANNIGKLPNKKSKKGENSDDSSSESDIENYLQPIDQIDLNSTYFQITKLEEKNSFEAIESNIFAGINRLSDSESEVEEQNNELSPVKKPKKSKKTKVKDPKPIPVISFQHVQDYTRKLEEAKKMVEKYEANKKKKEEKQEMSADRKSDVENQDISNLLAVGETKLDSSTEPQTSMRSSDFESFSESEKEDWEEVEERDVKETRENVGIPQSDLQITVELPTLMRKKKGRDLVASMKRRLNRIRKENQVLVHKVHLLCWIGHGNYINGILNNEGLLALVMSLIPTQYCNQSGNKKMNHLEEILKWYNNTVPNIEKRTSKDMALDKLLKLQIIRKEAFNKKMLVYIFVSILRSLGIQCRLVLSFQVTPLRPPASELHSLSTKIDDTKIIKENKQEASNSKDMSPESHDIEINSDEKKIQNGEEKNEHMPEKEFKKHTGTSNEDKNNENKNETVKENKRTRNAKKTSNLDTVPKKSDEKKTRKTKKQINKTGEKENNSENINNSGEKLLIDNSKTSNSKQKNSSTRSSKTRKQESLKVESEVKPKTRSQSTKEETSQNKTSNQLDTKPSTRSKSTSQLDSEESNISGNTQMKKRLSLSLRSRNNKQNLPKIPQMDGADDSDDSVGESTTSKTKRGVLNKLSEEEETIPKTIKKPSKRLKSLPDYTEVDSDDDFKPQRPKRSAKTNTQNKNKSNSSENTKPKAKTAEHNKPVKNRKLQNQNDDDSDYSTHSTKQDSDSDDDESDYTPQLTKKDNDNSDDEFYESKVKVKRVKAKKDLDDVEPKPKKGFDVWVEVYLEAEEKWISVDVVKGQVHCTSELHSRASHPITYIMAWNNDNSVKDITQRYCPKWNTVTRKLRIDRKWWNDTIKPFEGQKTSGDKKEDEELALLQLEKPLPSTITEYKNHPLYVLKRHLLQVEGLYPPEPVTLGFIRGEAVYSRECVHRLYTREVWFKQAKVVKPGETAYKILKRPKWDKINRKILKDQPVEIFGRWQVEDYVPPPAENGMVPRNEYGNVELFQSCMLPKGTVHLQLPGLNKLARRMNIDCAPAMVGFDFHSGWNHPVFDGYVVCEEHSESLIAAWYIEQEEQEKREQEKMEKRVYGNWKKLIKGLLIRERLKARYDFGVPSQVETGTKKRKSKAAKFVSKKRRLCSDNESDSEGD